MFKIRDNQTSITKLGNYLNLQVPKGLFCPCAGDTTNCNG